MRHNVILPLTCKLHFTRKFGSFYTWFKNYYFMLLLYILFIVLFDYIS